MRRGYKHVARGKSIQSRERDWSRGGWSVQREWRQIVVKEERSGGRLIDRSIQGRKQLIRLNEIDWSRLALSGSPRWRQEIQVCILYPWTIFRQWFIWQIQGAFNEQLLDIGPRVSAFDLQAMAKLPCGIEPTEGLLRQMSTFLRDSKNNGRAENEINKSKATQTISCFTFFLRAQVSNVYFVFYEWETRDNATKINTSDNGGNRSTEINLLWAENTS